MGRIRSLDGLRGIAVGAVMASHAFWWVHGGFLGVDVFFVLSGYLITALLLTERERTGRISFIGFYRRRVARLAPAYLLMLAVATPLMAGPLRDSVRIPIWAAVGATAVYGANWVGMWQIDALGPIMHTWSLSIEEQFYVLWPLCFVLLCRSRRSLIRALAVAAGLVMVARTVGWVAHPGDWPYVATFTHSDGLLVGCLIAVLLGTRHAAGAPARRLPGGAVAVSVAVLGGLVAVLSVDSPATYLGGLTLAVAATAVLVWHLRTAPGGLLDRALGWGPLVGVGRISYGLYLYHLPIFQLVQRGQHGFVPTLSLEVGVTFAIALLSWFGLERPVQRLVARRWPPHRGPVQAAAPATPGWLDPVR